MLTLLSNGHPAPTAFLVGASYHLAIQAEGEVPVSVSWTLGRRGEAPQAGRDAIFFSPASLDPYYLGVVVLLATGRTLEQIFVLLTTGTAASTPLPVSVIWDSPSPAVGVPLAATIQLLDPVPVRSISWAAFFNSVPVQAGEGGRVVLQVAQPGIYRLLVTVLDAYGSVSTADSALVVASPFGLQSAIVPPPPSGTVVYLGAIYSPVVEGNLIQCSYLPYELTSLTDLAKLIPGTTHFTMDLDPEAQSVDDEVIVRTRLGNWTLKGPPTGLTDEALPYDYQHGTPFQPAPLDLNTHYTVEAWNVHGSQAAAYRFRVRFKCYQLTAPLYRYSPCDWSAYQGGFGARQRRLFALFTQADLHLDAESPQNRGGSRDIEAFATPNVSLVNGAFTRTRETDRSNYPDDHFYTQQNLAAIYESPAGVLGDFQVHAAYGTPGGLASYLDFSQPGHPRIVNRPKRLYGKMMIYGAAGAFEAGTVITARIQTGRAPGYVEVPVTVASSCYNPEFSRYLKVAETEVDVSDFEFDRTGVVISFTLNEGTVASQTPAYLPLAERVSESYYTGFKAAAIKVDTACFRDPVLVPVFEGTFAGSATALPDCNTLQCGPVGLYCYVEVGGATTYNAAQPLGFPAPFIARTDDQTKCYGYPSFLAEQTVEASGSQPLLGYTTEAGCGYGYRYVGCSSPGTLTVIYPALASPHAVVRYAQHCYAFSGSLNDLRPYPVVTAADVSPVAGCTDVVCTGSNAQGGTVAYLDLETQTEVRVSFPGMAELGIANIGVAAPAASTGYQLTPPGSRVYANTLDLVFPLFNAAEQANVAFTVTPSSIRREIVVLRAGHRLHYPLRLGVKKIVVPVEAGDRLALEFGSYTTTYRQYAGEVHWEKVVPVPHVYDAVSCTFTGPSAIRALGFTGFTSRDDYIFYGTLPADVEMALPNPDMAVTVQGAGGSELLLVRTRALGELRPGFGLPSYGGQALGSPAVFRFYAGRSIAGAHGEMDVWFASAGTLPAFLQVSPYKALALPVGAYRRTTSAGDTTRRGLRVVDAAGAAASVSPRIYADERGARLSAASDADAFVLASQTYIFNGTLDYGISDEVVRVIDNAAGWLTEDGYAYLTEDGAASWLI